MAGLRSSCYKATLMDLLEVSLNVLVHFILSFADTLPYCPMPILSI